MTHTPTANSRTLTIVLSDADWHALREVEPDAVAWLHARIQERLGGRAIADRVPAGRASGPAPEVTWDKDLY